jgi:hypothetical protein
VIKLQTEIRINAPPERVWAVLTDFAAYPGWNPYLVRVDRADAILTVHAVMIEGQPPLVQNVDLIGMAYPEMVWHGGLPDRSRFAGDHRFRVEAQANETRFRHFEHFTGSDAPALVAQHQDRIVTNFERFNHALKRRVEA